MRTFLILTTLFSAIPCFAYVPEYATLASRTAMQHGKGAYQVEQEVTYQKEAETYSVKETWTVLDEFNLRLTIEGRGPLKGLVSGTILYQGSGKTFFDGSRGLRTQRLGENWLEPLFYFRSSHYFRSRLAALHVTPEESLRDRAPLNADGSPAWQPQNYVRLSRAGGAITWAIGTPNAPTLWLEQDQFVVRKFRGPDQSILRADDYAKYADGFWFPRLKSYSFGSYNVRVQTLSVKSLGKLTAADPRFKSSNLATAHETIRLPEPLGLREFYSRFR